MNDAAKERNMIIGTEGGKDYLVIAEQDGFVLGLKPLLLIGMDNSQYGFRLRMQKNDHADIENEKANLELMQKAFAEVPWSKRSATRFSTVLLADCPYGVEFIDEIREQSLKGFGELLSTIEQAIAPVDVLDLLDTVAFISERYDSMLDEVETEWQKHKQKKKANKKQADKGVADVLSFPTPDDVE